MLSSKWEEWSSFHPDNAFRIEELLRWIADDAVVPFVGAGLSIDSGYPGWTAFLRELGAEFAVREPVDALLAHSEYERAADCLVERIGAAGFHTRLRETFAKTRRLRGAVRLLPEIFLGPILTSNFDRVLEGVYLEAGHPLSVVSGSSIQADEDPIVHGKPVLLKVHGDALDSERRVLTSSEYDRHYAPDAPLRRMLDAAFSRSHVLFLGASLGTDRTATVLQAAVEGGRALEHFALLEKPADEHQLGERNVALLRRGIRPIWYPAGRHDAVERFLRNARSRQLRRRPTNRILIAAALITGAVIAKEWLEKATDFFPPFTWATVSVQGERASVKLDRASCDSPCLPEVKSGRRITAHSTGGGDGAATVTIRRLPIWPSVDLAAPVFLDDVPDLTIRVDGSSLTRHAFTVEAEDADGGRILFDCQTPNDPGSPPIDYVLGSWIKGNETDRTNVRFQAIREFRLSFSVPAGARREWMDIEGIVRGRARIARTCRPRG